eukprot:7294888-Ditylum_brightwellii.AAC.2
MSKHQKESHRNATNILKNFAKYSRGQRKSLSPSNWLFQLSTILNVLHALVNGIFLVSICKKFISRRAAEAYVNNTDCTHLDQSKHQMWETLLYSTGSELSLNKTYWWLLYWLWEGGKAHLTTKHDCLESMTITIGRDISPSKVKHKDPHESIKQLGVLANLASDFSKELEWRQKYSANIASCIRPLHMKPKNCLLPVREYLAAYLPVPSCCDNVL